jgi:hypothetical protein
MKKIWLALSAIFFLSFFNGVLFGQTEVSASSLKSSVIDAKTKEVLDTSENVSLGNFIQVAEEYSIPILVVMVVISAFLALIGIIFKPLKAAAGGILGMSILFFVLVNYAPQIAGIMISIVDGIMSRITGSN